jgi:hypothetical protein
MGLLGRTLAGEQKRLAEQQAGLETSRTIVAQADGDRNEIARLESIGELTADAAADAFAEVAERERRHHAEIDRLQRVCSMVETSIAELEREAEAARYEAAVAAFRDRGKSALSASAEVASALRAIAGKVKRLESARAAAVAAFEAAEAICPDGMDTPAGADEPAWLDDETRTELLAFLQDGPVRPAAENAERSAQAHLAAEARDRVLIENAARAACAATFNPAREVERLPERLRERAWERVRWLSDQARAQKKANAA